MSDYKFQDILDSLKGLSAEQTIIIITLGVVGVLLKMIWRAWTFHYPNRSELLPKHEADKNVYVQVDVKAAEKVHIEPSSK